MGAMLGSSPLARGTHYRPYRPKPYRRLIPARAGNTHPASGSPSLSPAHPRSRGEHSRSQARDIITQGSSPLARGARVSYAGIPVTERLIPARAGNTMYEGLDMKEYAAHPRSRGEHDKNGETKRVTYDSSPLARGTREGAVCFAGGAGLIPAHAGNTAAFSRSSFGTPAHPRSRGEHHKEGIKNGHVCGSSPLARGTHASCPRDWCGHRLIPARAGNTVRCCSTRRRH